MTPDPAPALTLALTPCRRRSMLFEVRTCFDTALRIIKCPTNNQCSASKDQNLPEGRCAAHELAVLDSAPVPCGRARVLAAVLA